MRDPRLYQPAIRHTNDDIKEKIEQAKAKIKNCILAHKDGLPVKDFRDEYEKQMNEEISYLGLGYSSLFHMLRDIPEIQSSRNAAGEPVFTIAPKAQSSFETSKNHKQYVSTNKHRDIDQQIKDVKTMIKSCITANNKNGLSIHNLEDEYRKLTDESIPYLKLGYHSLFHLLRDIPEIQSSRNEMGEPVLMVKANSKTQHLLEMIKKQKDPKTNTREGRRAKMYFDGNARHVQRQQRYDAYRCIPGEMSSMQEKNPPEDENWGRPVIINRSNFEETTSIVVEPVVGNVQLIGDDYFLQLCIKYLNERLMRKHAKSAITCGTVQSGLTIDKAIKRLNRIRTISNRLVINVGTVDIYNRRTADEMIEDYKYLLKTIKSKFGHSSNQITLCTLPPIGNMGLFCESNKFNQYAAFNNWIRSFAKKNDYGLLDFFAEYVEEDSEIIDFQFFQQDARNVSGTRHPHVLWNYWGRQKAMKLLINL